jgi:hypothetical protein
MATNAVTEARLAAVNTAISIMTSTINNSWLSRPPGRVPGDPALPEEES